MPVPLPILEEEGFAFTAEQLAERVTPRTKLVILNSPANPTGGIVDRDLNVGIARVLADHDCWILSDEVYSQLLYAGTHDSLASHGLLDRTILLDGFSKTFAMTGWRLGYAAVPDAAGRAHHPPDRQLGLLHAARRAARRRRRAGGAARRGRHHARGVPPPPRRRRPRPQRPARRELRRAAGRVLRLPQRRATPGIDTGTLANRLLDEAGVAVLAGTSFGANGDGYLRLSYANSLENLEAALAAMGELLAG